MDPALHPELDDPPATPLRIGVAVADQWRRIFFPDEQWTRLERLGDVRVTDGAVDDREAYRRLLSDREVIISGWRCPALDAELLDAAGHLRLLAHSAGTVKPYVTAASWARGIRVTQAGQGMAPAVAESALAMTLALLHRMPRFDHALHAGVGWGEAKQAPARRELAGSTVGVVGASRTGRSYIAMVRALGARVLVADPYLTDADAAELGVRQVELDELLRASRVVALHAPVTPQTHHLLGARELALIPDGGLVVNTARAWLVDEAALVAELSSGRIDAGLDVYATEPLGQDHPLRSLPNVLLVPHEAGGTVEARHRQGQIVVDEVTRFAHGHPLRHEVTEQLLARMG